LSTPSAGTAPGAAHRKSHPQPAIEGKPPDHLLAVALTLTAADPTGAATAIEALREVVKRELEADLDGLTADAPKDQPSAETGELGFTDHYERYNLNVLVAFGSTAYDKLGVAADERPQDLIAIPWADLSDVPTVTPDNGDVFLQIRSNSVYINEHVLRRVSHELGAQITIAWAVVGEQRHHAPNAAPSRDQGRALIGFLDGTSNLDPRTNPADAALIYVDPGHIDYPPQVPPVSPGQPSPYGPQPPIFPDGLRVPPTREPEWCHNGSYVVVRASTFDAAAWDARALGDQEHTVGRFKLSGQPLDHADDVTGDIAEPNFAADPDGNTTPLTAHVRKANPRGPDDDNRRIFRRGYPLIIHSPQNGPQRGLVFICFGRTITTQFEFITRAWTANPNFPRQGAGVDALRAIETVLCGGYFFAPPLANAHEPWSWVVPATATAMATATAATGPVAS
jgi:deferrochelatase/peroxidase EfeB